jgi:hypothetical protein
MCSALEINDLLEPRRLSSKAYEHSLQACFLSTWLESCHHPRNKPRDMLIVYRRVQIEGVDGPNLYLSGVDIVDGSVSW